ncbi:MAG: fibronectin type III domain-containing protein, partial [Bacteroidales bacterium]|nr:fibronectin type III domain-containing protein [Bacteroidales bacterium]
MKRIVQLLLVAIIMLPMSAKSQSATDTVPYCCNFESAVERVYWRFANSNENKWAMGIANSNGGLYGLYISNDGGISNYYQANTTYSYAYRKIYIPAGVYEVSYDWIANGYYSTSYSYMRAFLIPATVTFSGGTLYNGLSATTLPSGAISLDGNTARLLQTTWTTFNNPIVNVPTTQDYYLVFFWFNSSTSSSSYQPPAAIDNICIDPVSCPKPMQLTRSDLGNGCVVLSWTDYGNPQPTGWIIEYGQRGFTRGHGTKIYTTSKPDTICGLQSDVTYEFLVRAICDTNDTSNYSEPINVRYCTSAAQCLDFTNLRGPGVVCTYGRYQYYGQTSASYPGPYADTGVVDLGPASYGRASGTPGSRHTVNTDPSLHDPLCPQILRIPPDECKSVRLGSYYGGYICQSVSYTMQVDTSNADILLFKYACIFNDVNHGTTQQPRFVLEILDQQGNLISPTCGAADYSATDVSGGSVGGTWYTVTGAISFMDTIVDSVTGAINVQSLSYSSHTIRARDWTPLGLNISAYHGQTIVIRITSYSCGQSGPNHCGYVYYTLGCSKARIIANTCGGHAQVATLTAPSGFRYRWYNPSLPGWTSNQQTVQVNIDSSIYYCEVSFMDDTSCKFTMSTMAAPRFPHARFTASLDTSGCNYGVIVNNTSYASISATDTNVIG